MSRLGQHDVGHEGVITGRDALSLRSSIANLQGVTQSPPFGDEPKKRQI